MTVRSSNEAEDYRLNRLLVKRKDYFVLFGQDDDIVPYFCPLCEYLLRTRDDEYSMKSLGVCNSCAVAFAYPNMKKWNEGWRPAKEVVDQMPVRTLSFKLDIP